MADQVFTVALDDKGFATGLSRIERQNKLVSDRVESAWARQGKSFEGKWSATAAVVAKSFKQLGLASGAGFALAQRALKAYAEEFPGAAAGAEHLEHALHGLMVNLGRDIETSGVAEALASIVEWFDTARNAAANFVHDAVGGMWGGEGTGAEIDAIQKQNEQIEARKRLMADVLDLQIALAEAEGRTAEAAELRRTKQGRADQERLTALVAKVGADSPELAKLRGTMASTRAAKKMVPIRTAQMQALDVDDEIAADMAEAAGHTRVAHNIREGMRLRKQMQGVDVLAAQGADVSGLRPAVLRASAANRARISREEDSSAVQSAELQKAAELRRIEQLSLEGHEKEAALARVRLDYAKQRAEIEEKDLVTLDEKASLLGELAGQEARALELTGAGFDRKKAVSRGARTLEAGMGANAAAVFGVGGHRDPGREQLTEAKKQTSLLHEISRNTSETGGAKYGE